MSHETGLRARLRALPTRTRFIALLAVAVALSAWQVVFHLRPDVAGPKATYSPGLFVGLYLALGGLFVFGAWRLLRGASAPVRSAAWERMGALALLLGPAVAALLAPLGTDSPELLAAWGQPGSCFTYGGALVLPVVAAYWVFERRDRVPWTGLVSAGALAGIVANLLLQAHCPSEHLGHLLLGHATIGVVWALLLGLLSKPLQRLG